MNKRGSGAAKQELKTDGKKVWCVRRRKEENVGERVIYVRLACAENP